MIDTNIFQDKTAVYYTLGCKLNFSETSTIGKILRDAGVRTARKGEKADICVVNTCSVTEVADKKCRQAIHRLVKQHPGAFVVVTGCYAQLKPETVAKIEGVDVVLGAEQKKDLLQYLGNLQKNESGEAYASAACSKYSSVSPRVPTITSTPIKASGITSFTFRTLEAKSSVSYRRRISFSTSSLPDCNGIWK